MSVPADYKDSSTVVAKFTEINKYKVRYLEAGENNPYYVLYIHGLGGYADRWLKVIPKTAEKFHVIAPDLLGFGYSDKPLSESYTIPFFSDFVENFMKTLKIPSAHFVGSSMGGHIAFYLASDKRKLVNRLIAVSPTGLTNKPTDVYRNYVQAVYFPTEGNVKKALDSLAFDSSMIDEEMVRSFQKIIRQSGAINAYFKSFWNLGYADSFEERLKLINSPTLLVWGEHDQIVPAKYAQKFASLIPNSKTEIIQNCGHIPYIEKPDIFTEMVLKHLQD